MADGQCLCGKVQYEVSGSLGEVRYCHCTRCRRATGSAFSANARIPALCFTLLAGQDWGPRVRRKAGHLPSVLLPLWVANLARLDREPEHIRVRLGGLSGELDVRITAHVWLSSKSSWYEIVDSLPRYSEPIEGPPLQDGKQTEGRRSIRRRRSK
jgi:hypothetical protein